MAPTDNTAQTTDPDNVGSLSHKSILVLIWVCFGVAALFVALRTYIRFRSPTTSRVAPFEDCWLFLALASLLGLCVLETIQLPSLYYITGILTGAVPLTSAEVIINHTESYLLYQFPITILFWTVLWSVKGAFLSLYWRLFRDLNWYRRIWFGLAVFTFLVYGGCVTTLVLSCGTDVRNFFTFNMCAGPDKVWLSNFSVLFSTAVDVFTDLCIMAMPLRLIYNINVSMKQKIGLVGVFSLGFVMIVFAIIRANQSLAKEGFVNLTLLLVWSTLAASISVIVGTLPALKVLITARARASENRSAGGIGSQGSRATQPKMSSFGTRKSIKSAKSVALASIRRDSNNNAVKSMTGSNSDAGESQEEILVQRDVTVSYSQSPRPSPTRYHQRYQDKMI